MNRIQRHTRIHYLALFTGLLFACIVVAPTVSLAQEQDELRATILSAILSDPRTSGFSQEQLDAIVSVLTDEAKRGGLVLNDITWSPQDVDTLAAQDNLSYGMTSSVCDSGGVLCLFSEAFGFVGPDTTIPFTLGASSMALIWIFAEMLHRRRMRV